MSRKLATIATLAVVIAAACSDGAAPLREGSAAQVDATVQDGALHVLGWPRSGGEPQFNFEGTLASAASGDASRFQLLLSGSASMPITIGSSTSATGSKDVLTWSHTVESGPNRALVVGVSIRNGGKTVRRVTYGGTDLSFVGARNNHDDAVRVELWYLPAPAVGTAPVQIELSGGAKTVGGATSFSGVDPRVVPAFTSAGSEGTGTTHPIVTLSSAPQEVVVAAVATEGDAATMTPEGPGQTQRWLLFYGSSGGDVAGAGSTLPGASTVEVRWKTKTVKWAVGAISLQPAPLPVPVLDRYQTTFWAVRGQPRYVQINYQDETSATYPFARLDVTSPTERPDGSPIAVGDSVLITVNVDSATAQVELLPHGLRFDPSNGATLQIWYAGVNGDLNADGVVDAKDEYIEQSLLGLWYQSLPGMPWVPISAEQSTLEDWFRARLEHFSGFAVAY